MWQLSYERGRFGLDKLVFVTQTANKTTLGLISQTSRREFYLVNKEAFALQEAVDFAGEEEGDIRYVKEQ